MSAKHKLLHLKKLYDNGTNIIEYLKNEKIDKTTTFEDIMMSYDLQAGSYTKFSVENPDYINAYTSAIFDELSKLEDINSFLEVGVGEATIFTPLTKRLSEQGLSKFFGFDISWSRVRYALSNQRVSGIDAELFCANLFEIPLPDHSIDVVFTNHAIEPNGGKELTALKELCRVSAKYVVLLEPDSERASKEAKTRMVEHGYVQNLKDTALALGVEVIKDEAFCMSQNDLNPTGLLILKMNASTRNPPTFQCPVSRSNLEKFDNLYTDLDCGLIYPIIDSIPCFTLETAIVGTKFGDFD